MKHVFSLFLLIFIFTNSIFAQETFISNTNQNLYKGNNTGDYNDVSGLPIVKAKTQEQISLENQINALRQSNNVDRNLLEQMNNRLSELNGNVVKMAEYYGGGITRAQNNPPFIQEDNISNTRIYNSSNTVKGIATFTEQIGANAGRIWVVYAFSANTSSPDSLRVIYSTNGGISYIGYANISLGGTDKVNYEDLDIEIIENTSGDKYLWCVYGLRSSGGTGTWFTGGFNLDITSFAGNLWALSWPGNSTTYRYYDVKLTSDNAHWPSVAYLYLICSFDSVDASSNHVNTQKFARCLNPYLSTSPTFTYLPTRYFWYENNGNYIRTLYSDIAYFYNGGDSVVVSFSGVPDSTSIFFAKCGYGVAPTIGTLQQGSETGYKLYARLSSNSSDNGSVICVFNQYTGTNRNVKYFRTTNYGNFSSIYQSALWGSTVNTNYQPSIVGKRNGNTHLFAFNTLSASDSLHYVVVTSSGGTTQYTKMNSATLLSGTQGSKPGFRFVSGDSCYVLYSESGPLNIWSAAGCSGSISSVGNQNQIPASYKLNQNYPNPFNPTTNIQYSIPINGLVKIVVYDILGKEVATLVNEVKTAGVYIVDFDASSLSSGIYFYKITSGNFSNIKKMILIK